MEKVSEYKALSTASSWAMAQQLNELKKENNVKIEIISTDEKGHFNAIVAVWSKTPTNNKN